MMMDAYGWGHIGDGILLDWIGVGTLTGLVEASFDGTPPSSPLEWAMMPHVSICHACSLS